MLHDQNFKCKLIQKFYLIFYHQRRLDELAGLYSTVLISSKELLKSLQVDAFQIIFLI